MTPAERIAACEHRWSIRVEAPFPDRSYNWVAPAGDIVLKLGQTSDAELASEAAALRAYAGNGAVRLVDVDLALGALLLERVRPGTNLVGLDEERATTIAIDVMQRLHAAPLPPPVSEIPSLAAWTDGIERAAAAGFAPALIDRAARLRGELLASAPTPVLLHGDLHHYNVLAGDRETYVAIDPKGVAGDPAYEPSVFLYNPFERVPDARTLARRIDRFAEVLDRERVVGWAYVQCVLSAWWTREDEGRDDPGMLAFAELL